MVLRDSFIWGKSKSHVIMIACISPNKLSAEHTWNTLRYAERLKSSTDDRGAVEKYMDSKPILSKSQEINFYYNELDNEYSENYEENNEENEDEKDIKISPDFEQEDNLLDNLQRSHMTEYRQVNYSQNHNLRDTRQAYTNKNEDSYNYFEINPNEDKEIEQEKQDTKEFDEEIDVDYQVKNKSGFVDIDSSSLLVNPPQRRPKVRDYNENKERKSIKPLETSYNSSSRYKKRFGVDYSTYYKKAYQNHDKTKRKNTTNETGAYNRRKEVLVNSVKNIECWLTQRPRIRDNETKLNQDHSEMQYSGSKGSLSYIKYVKPIGVNSNSKLNSRLSASTKNSRWYMNRKGQTAPAELKTKEDWARPTHRKSYKITLKQRPIYADLEK